MPSSQRERIEAADQYLSQRTGKLEHRMVRYEKALKALIDLGLDDSHTVTDLGAGWTEFDYTLRTKADWAGRYIPIDAGIDGEDLEFWWPARRSDFYVALEVLEHLENWEQLLDDITSLQPQGVVVSAPNPETVNVLEIDDDHRSIITADDLERHGFEVTRETFYGGVFSEGEPDSLFAVWRG